MVLSLLQDAAYPVDEPLKVQGSRAPGLQFMEAPCIEETCGSSV